MRFDTSSPTISLKTTKYGGMGANIGGMGDGCVDNVTFRNLYIDHPSLCAVEIKTEHGKDNASFVSNVHYENVTITKSMNASQFPCISIIADYEGDGHPYDGNFLPRISNVSFKDVNSLGCATPIVINCDPKFPCINVTFTHIGMNKNMTCAGVDECSAVGVAPGNCCPVCD